MSSDKWDGNITLGDVVSAWAQQQGISVQRIHLMHESDEDYLQEDVWWCDVGGLAQRWGATMSFEIKIPSEDQVRACTFMSSR